GQRQISSRKNIHRPIRSAVDGVQSDGATSKRAEVHTADGRRRQNSRDSDGAVHAQLGGVPSVVTWQLNRRKGSAVQSAAIEQVKGVTHLQARTDVRDQERAAIGDG